MRQTLIAIAAALTLALMLTPGDALADDARAGCNVYGCYEAGGGCNVYGCYEAGGGCNVYGCWARRGGCNVYGCWNSRRGACNVYGCSDAGECSVYGCPAEDERRHRHRQRWRHSSIAPEAPVFVCTSS